MVKAGCKPIDRFLGPATEYFCVDLWHYIQCRLMDSERSWIHGVLGSAPQYLAKLRAKLTGRAGRMEEPFACSWSMLT